MSVSDPLLDRALIEDAFRRLGERLVARGVVGDLYIFGGAAMALAYDARRSTRDIDAVLQPHGIVLDEAKFVADEMGLPPWWLNEQRAVRALLRSVHPTKRLGQGDDPLSQSVSHCKMMLRYARSRLDLRFSRSA